MSDVETTETEVTETKKIQGEWTNPEKGRVSGGYRNSRWNFISENKLYGTIIGGCSDGRLYPKVRVGGYTKSGPSVYGHASGALEKAQAWVEENASEPL